jgi:hypothetical protein
MTIGAGWGRRKGRLQPARAHSDKQINPAEEFTKGACRHLMQCFLGTFDTDEASSSNTCIGSKAKPGDKAKADAGYPYTVVGINAVPTGYAGEAVDGVCIYVMASKSCGAAARHLAGIRRIDFAAGPQERLA